MLRSTPHPFPARMASAIPWDALGRAEGRPLRVLDPMMGSGTVVVVARELGHEAQGFDTDPLAVMMTRVWCVEVSNEVVRKRAQQVLVRAKRELEGLSGASAYPRNADAETKQFIRFWFDLRNRKELTALSRAIGRVRDADIRDVLWCSFSRLIITKKAGVSRAMDVAHSRPHVARDAKPRRPFEWFLSAVERVLRARDELSGKGPSPLVQRGDARSLPVDDACVDLIVTSPPYLNAIDYLRGHKFTLVWMGHPVTKLRELRASNIGSEVSRVPGERDGTVELVLSRLRLEQALPRRQKLMFARYLADMHSVLTEAYRVLVPGGRAMLVLGNNTVRGVFVRNAHAIGLLGEAIGFEVEDQFRRKLPPNRRYLPPPAPSSGESLEARMREEVVLTLAKPQEQDQPPLNV